MPDLTPLMNQLVDRFNAEAGERGVDNIDAAFGLVAELLAETDLCSGSIEYTCVAATLNAIAARDYNLQGASGPRM